MNRGVPAYGLYGEAAAARFPDPLHIETIAARSAIHDWRIRPHRHADLWQVFVLAAGGGSAQLDGSIIPLAPPLALLVPPLAVHGFTFAPGTQGHVVSIPADTLARGLGRDRMPLAGPGPALLALDKAGQARLSVLLALAEQEFAADAPARGEALGALAALLALHMQRLLAERRPAAGLSPGGGARASLRRGRGDLPPSPQARLAQAFLAQVEADFRLQPPLADRARRLRVSVPHLSRACRAVLGRSALAVVHDRLFLEARRHLVYTSMTVQEIAYGLGFSDPAYFTRFFTDRAGRSPSEYRKAGAGPVRPETDVAPALAERQSRRGDAPTLQRSAGRHSDPTSSKN